MKRYNITVGATILRTTIYMVGGVLPAFGLALLSLILMGSGQVFYVLLSTFAWLGTCGLVLAALNRPTTTESRRRLAITVMLMMGLLAMSPLLLEFFKYFNDELWINWVILGPTLLALHYMWEVARISCSGK
jgi:Trk-type K+ transport system membrane component